MPVLSASCCVALHQEARGCFFFLIIHNSLHCHFNSIFLSFFLSLSLILSPRLSIYTPIRIASASTVSAHSVKRNATWCDRWGIALWISSSIYTQPIHIYGPTHSGKYHLVSVFLAWTMISLRFISSVVFPYRCWSVVYRWEWYLSIHIMYSYVLYIIDDDRYWFANLYLPLPFVVSWF